jgi:hypothetical protein
VCELMLTVVIHRPSHTPLRHTLTRYEAIVMRVVVCPLV